MNQIISETYIRECLDKARYYEFCSDAEKAQSVLSPILDNLTGENDLGPKLNCEIFLVYGSVISQQGLTGRERHFQETAMNFLTEARELAAEMGERDLTAEAEKQIGVAYWRLGQNDNAVAYFDSALSHYNPEDRRKNTVCLGVLTNLIGVNFDLQNTSSAKKLIKRIEPTIAKSGDLWLQTYFYTEAAGIYLALGELSRAVPFLENAVRFSTEAGNQALLANALNNLALVYLTKNDPATAREYVERAIEIFDELKQIFTLAMAFETKAQILLAEGNLPEARRIIEESIALLEKSESYAPLAESLWTQIAVMARAGEKSAAIDKFGDLMQMVKNRLSEYHINFYREKFASLFYLQSGENFYEKTENYRRNLIQQALSSSDSKVSAIAKTLGISHQNTSLLLKKYPDLCEKYDIRLRTRATDSFLPRKNHIKRISGDSFSISLQSDRLTYLGLEKEMVVSVRVSELTELDLSKPVVIQDTEKQYHCGFLVSSFDMYAFEDGRGNIERTFFASDIIKAGQVEAIYDAETDEFTPLENQT